MTSAISAAQSAEMTHEADQVPASTAMAALLDEFVGLGLRHIVVCPGSRSQALALVAAELERQGRAQVHVRLDERSAGFQALGMGREDGIPAAVVVTSGTAVANLLPAVLEASHSGVPMLVLSADRPPELRGVGANQTTRQPGLFSDFTRFDADAPVPEDTDIASGERYRELARAAWNAATDASPGPVHVNLPVREPLSGPLPAWLAEHRDPDSSCDEAETTGAMYQGGGGIGVVPTEQADVAPERWTQARTVVIAGAGAGPAAATLAERFGWPLIAEVVSGARFGPNLVHGYRTLLADEDLGGQIERVIVVGHPTLAREVAALLQRTDIDVIAVAGPGESINLNGETCELPLAAIDAAAVPGTSAWLARWQHAARALRSDVSAPAPDAEALTSPDAERRRAALADEVATMRAPIDRESLVDAIWRATWPHDRLVFGSSRLVRVADAVLGGKKIPVHANRGLAGIDGTIATGLGIAVASQAGGAPGVTRVLLGDLAMLHDVGSLLFPGDETEPRIQVIVGNDGGGTIFDALEVAGTAGQQDLDRMLYTPHTVRLEHLALAYGWEYTRVSHRSALEGALATPVGGRQLIEVALPR